MQERAFSGDVVERQTYLNGTRYFLLEGADDAHEWTWTIAVTLPKVAGDPIREGDLALQRGDECWFGDVVDGSYREEIDESTDAPVTAVQLELRRRDDAQSTLMWSGASATMRLVADTCELRLAPR